MGGVLPSSILANMNDPHAEVIRPVLSGPRKIARKVRVAKDLFFHRLSRSVLSQLHRQRLFCNPRLEQAKKRKRHTSRMSIPIWI